MALKLYNSLTQKKQIFRPLKDKKVGLYSCGPTVYQYAHLGNLRTYIFTDILRRTLEFLGYQVHHIMNITDVGHLTQESQDSGEDKIEASARRAGKTALEIARFYERAFLKDLQKLQIKLPHKMPRATEHIQDQIELVRCLEAKGYTYKTSDGIYFDTSKLTTYPRLTPQKKEAKQAGARVPVSQDKKHPADFALWKFSPKHQKRQLEWESPWGRGFPGWHLECSAMSARYLGIPFDIHTGGIDLKEIHHPNEIAQTEAATGKLLAKFWLHGGFLSMQGTKMAKSRGNILTLKEIEQKGFDALDYRLLVLQNHYRRPMNFSLDLLKKAQAARQDLLYHYQKLISKTTSQNGGLTKDLEKFQHSLENDLNTPQALAVLFKAKNSDYFPALLKQANQVLAIATKQELADLKIPPKIQRLLQKRENLRKQGNFQEADQLREQIQQAGWQVEDTPAGPQLTPQK